MEIRCVFMNFGIFLVENKFLCELNDYVDFLIFGDELMYVEGFIYFVYFLVF